MNIVLELCSPILLFGSWKITNSTQIWLWAGMKIKSQECCYMQDSSCPWPFVLGQLERARCRHSPEQDLGPIRWLRSSSFSVHVSVCSCVCTHVFRGRRLPSSVLLNHFLSYFVRQGLELADRLDWLFSVDKIPRRSIHGVKQQQQVSLILMGATKLFLDCFLWLYDAVLHLCLFSLIFIQVLKWHRSS